MTSAVGEVNHFCYVYQEVTTALAYEASVNRRDLRSSAVCPGTTIFSRGSA